MLLGLATHVLHLAAHHQDTTERVFSKFLLPSFLHTISAVMCAETQEDTVPSSKTHSLLRVQKTNSYVPICIFFLAGALIHKPRCNITYLRELWEIKYKVLSRVPGTKGVFNKCYLELLLLTALLQQRFIIHKIQIFLWIKGAL